MLTRRGVARAGLVLLGLVAHAAAEEFTPRRVTPHYALAGDVLPARLIEYGAVLEFAHREYSRLFSTLREGGAEEKKSPQRGGAERGRGRPSSALQPGAAREGTRAVAGAPENNLERERFRVVIFQSRKSYDDFSRRYLEGGAEFTDGMFIATRKLLLILDQGNSQETHETLLHEAFHQFMHRHAPAAPLWVNEGLATLFGSAQLTPQGLAFKRPHRTYWSLCRKLIDTGQAASIDALLTAGRPEFYSSAPVAVPGFEDVRQRSIYYAQAYTLIHLLVHNEEGRRRLRDYLRDLGTPEAGGGAEVLERHFSAVERRALEETWKRHVKSRPESRGE